jgi:molybdenum cofactor biosynthesis enzyme MoaA
MVKFPSGLLAFLKRNEAVAETPSTPAPAIQGYVDEISLTHVIGWVRDLSDARRRVEVEAVTAGRVVARGQGADPYPALAEDGFGDARYGFTLSLPAGLSPVERAGITIRAGGVALARGAALQGYVDQRSVNHVAGWVRNRFDPAERVAYEVLLGGQVIATGVADRFYMALAQQSLGDAFYGFLTLFPDALSEEERDMVSVRPLGAEPLALSPRLDTRFELVSYAAMDIVNNCNLRCPFCLFDYSDTKSTRFMSDETFDAAIRLLPLVRDAGFWLSCLHEPSLHPKFQQFIERIPRQWRSKIMFTTNLAKRMPDSYFAALADSGVFHINVSIESMDPPIYEKFRKGARWPIFKENWDRMVRAWKAHENPPHLRYIMMAYKSNLREIPSLIKYLREERCAWQVEIRYTFDLDHIPESFRRSEYLESEDWAWLAEQLADYPIEEVILTAPWEAPKALEAALEPAPEVVLAAAEPEAPPEETEQEYPTLPLNLHVKWDGRFAICDKWDHPSEQRQIATANITTLEAPFDFLTEVSKAPLPGLVQGYIDELSTTGVVGWMRDAIHPALRVAFEVAVTNAEGTRVIARGRAGEHCQALADYGWADARYGFRVEFETPISTEERDTLEILPENATGALKRAPKYQGYVDARTTTHVAGWLRNRFAPEERLEHEVVLQNGPKERILAAGIADAYDPELARHGVGDARYGFSVRFEPALTPAERDAVIVRPALGTMALALSPRLVTE